MRTLSIARHTMNIALGHACGHVERVLQFVMNLESGESDARLANQICAPCTLLRQTSACSVGFC